MTARSIDRRTASSPLQLATRALMTSPVGTCTTVTTQSIPGRADNGRFYSCLILLSIMRMY